MISRLEAHDVVVRLLGRSRSSMAERRTPAGRCSRRGAVHRRLGSPRRPLARRFGPRDARLTHADGRRRQPRRDGKRRCRHARQGWRADRCHARGRSERTAQLAQRASWCAFYPTWARSSAKRMSSSRSCRPSVRAPLPTPSSALQEHRPPAPSGRAERDRARNREPDPVRGVRGRGRRPWTARSRTAALEAGHDAIYLSGPRAPEVAALPFEGVERIVVGDAVGAASAVKMSTASVYKGTSALLLQALLAAHANGVLAHVLADLRAAAPELVANIERRVASGAAKSVRYVGEMHEIATTQSAAGLTPRSSRR